MDVYLDPDDLAIILTARVHFSTKSPEQTVEDTLRELERERREILARLFYERMVGGR